MVAVNNSTETETTEVVPVFTEKFYVARACELLTCDCLVDFVSNFNLRSRILPTEIHS